MGVTNHLLTGMILQVEGIVMSDYQFSGEAGCAENPKDLVEEMWEILVSARVRSGWFSEAYLEFQDT